MIVWNFFLPDSSSPMYLLGYMSSHNRIYLADKDVKIYGYSLSLNLIEYQTAILRDEMETAAEILPSIPKEQRNKVARFLEARGMKSIVYTIMYFNSQRLSGLKELALQVTTDNASTSLDSNKNAGSSLVFIILQEKQQI